MANFKVFEADFSSTQQVIEPLPFSIEDWQGLYIHFRGYNEKDGVFILQNLPLEDEIKNYPETLNGLRVALVKQVTTSSVTIKKSLWFDNNDPNQKGIISNYRYGDVEEKEFSDVPDGVYIESWRDVSEGRGVTGF